MSLSGIFKFLIGFAVGILLLAGTGVATAFYFWTKLSVKPPMPVFAEERPKPTSVAKKGRSPKASNSQSSKPSTPKASPAQELPPGAYKARITWPQGLSLRDAPGSESNRIGGVAFNQQVFILKESDDKRWQQVRLAEGTQEGWIKSGNSERVN
jgi:hypothetical protein